jgi:hypothetical protein
MAEIVESQESLVAPFQNASINNFLPDVGDIIDIAIKKLNKNSENKLKTISKEKDAEELFIEVFNENSKQSFTATNEKEITTIKDNNGTREIDIIIQNPKKEIVHIIEVKRFVIDSSPKVFEDEIMVQLKTVNYLGGRIKEINDSMIAINEEKLLLQKAFELVSKNLDHLFQKASLIDLKNMEREMNYKHEIRDAIWTHYVEYVTDLKHYKEHVNDRRQKNKFNLITENPIKLSTIRNEAKIQVGYYQDLFSENQKPKPDASILFFAQCLDSGRNFFESHEIS